ncbi:efflux RND transporter periplasmic adaptor subunit [Thiohalorhabdus methylotrophus]|uniref:Efflux RND transporter periplasmic adaptor subunit n=1 Tax=Thiohalorhabdus methylotrophus TaxID=3242694 RepID=A0ABV4TV86_9GAMM
MHWRKRLIGGTAGLLLAVALAYGFWPRPLPVDTAVVSRGPLRETIEQEGQTRVRDRFVVAAPVTGRLVRHDWEVGDRVEKGQELLRIDPAASPLLDPRSRARAEARAAQTEAAMDRARAELEAAESQADFAEHSLNRIRRLHQGGKASDAELDQARNRARVADAGLRSARFSVRVAEFERNMARTALERGTDAMRPLVLTAPVSGKILAVQEESRVPVQPGQPLLTIGDTASLEAVMDVLSSDAVRIRAGTAVEFIGWGGEGALEGRVRRVEPAGYTKVSALGVEEQRVDVVADFTSPRAQWRRLGHGYRVDARFILWAAEDALQVPESALFRYKGHWAVFMVAEGEARRREVEVGHRGGLRAQVLAGLQEGQRVIVHPPSKLRPGARVAARGEQGSEYLP